MYSPAWDPFCPQGGNFYACGNNTKFVGCCAYVDPCQEEGGCSAGNLRVTSFPADKYGTFGDQQCDAGSFYTCTGTSPVWWGCCTINPCANSGCPTEDMAAAFLSNNPSKAADMDPYPPLSTASSAASSTSSSSPTTSAASSGSSSPSPSGTSTSSSISSSAAFATQTPESKSTPVGAIAGGAAGGFALLCAIIAIIWLVRRHARKSSEKHNRESGTNTGGFGAPELAGAYGGNTNDKAAMAEVTAMGSPYKDSPSTVPPYSNQTSPAPGYQSGWGPTPMQQQGYPQGYPVHEAEARSQFKPYSPNEGQAGNYSPYGPPHQFSPSMSQTSDPMNSVTWTNNSVGVPPRVPVSAQYGAPFARVHQGPPQEMGGDVHPTNIPQNFGLGVHHIGDSYAPAPEPPRAELDGRGGSSARSTT